MSNTISESKKDRVATNITIVVRTALEDSTLKRELEGYAQYMEPVRYCLLLGVW